MNFVFIVCALVSFVLFTITVLLIVKSKNKLENYNQCKGIIVSFCKNTSETRVKSYESEAISPVVSYEVDGKKYEHIGNYYSTRMRLGQMVDVFYDKNDATKATLKTGLYFAPAITGGLAGFFFVATVVVLFLLKVNTLLV